ncbi:MAG TPA: HepT-like ribonuclease domain-containing protein [Thermoanaerobaculia bacterium]|nr:HepT-like ribonuclease domain-containing protein [Thermoanaerobaculia bacterium]
MRPFLEDVLAYAEKVDLIRAGLSSADDLRRDDIRFLALSKALEIIGEAVKGVPDDVRALAPSVPWRSMAGLRDKLTHGYREVDVDIVWRSATVELPAVVPTVRDLLARLTGEEGSAPK